MIRKFKALGLALVAVFAMSALVASAAQAETGEGELTVFGSTSGSVIAKATQVGEHVFTLTSHPVTGGFANTKCKKATFTGTKASVEGESSVTAHPTYTECTAFGQNATITTTGCDYALNTETATAAGFHVSVDVVCSGANVIKITTGTCEVQVGSQSNLTTSEAVNAGGSGTAMDLNLDTNVSGITYNVTKDNIGCPLSGTGVDTDGDYVGDTTVTATDAETGAAAGITLS